MAGGRDFESELLAVLGKLRRKVPAEEMPGLVNEIKALPYPSQIKTDESWGLLSTIHDSMISDVGDFETIREKIERLKSTMPAYHALRDKLYSINPDLRDITQLVKHVKKMQILQKTIEQREKDSALAKLEKDNELFVEAMLAPTVSGGGRRRRRGSSTRRRKQQRKKSLRRK